MATTATDAPMTPNVLRALALVALAMRARTGEYWRPVEMPLPGIMYDFADPATGLVGQCWIREDGEGWFQEPRGTAPVVLEFVRRPPDWRGADWPRYG